MKHYYIFTFGCQMNEHDTEVLCGLLESMGYEPVDNPGDSDLIVINTCAVRRKAEDKVTGLLGELVAWKKERKGRMLAVGGCMAQQEETTAYIKRKFKHVDIIFGTHSLPRFPALIEESADYGRTVVDIGEEHIGREGLPAARKTLYKAWIPVIYGCTNFCSYCVVPHVRGPERSRSMDDILTEVKKLAADGCKEITLLGQNVNAYGKDLYGESRFPHLLEELDGVEGLDRIRFMTSHPRDFEERMIEVIARAKNICEHFHLPLQSGSNSILKKMNRGYTRESYNRLVRMIRDLIPGSSVTTDLIVGFPGEKDADFEDTLEMVRSIKFDAAYTFVYSERSGTPAVKMKGSVPPETRKERITKLIEEQQNAGLEINRRLVRQTAEVLVEGVSKSDPEKITGRTRTNKLIHFPGESTMEGRLCHVKILKAGTWHLSGEMVRTNPEVVSVE